MAVHQAQVAKIEGRAIPYAYGAPNTRTGPHTRMGVPYMRMGLVICLIRVSAYGIAHIMRMGRTGQNTRTVHNTSILKKL